MRGLGLCTQTTLNCSTLVDKCKCINDSTPCPRIQQTVPAHVSIALHLQPSQTPSAIRQAFFCTSDLLSHLDSNAATMLKGTINADDCQTGMQEVVQFSPTCMQRCQAAMQPTHTPLLAAYCRLEKTPCHQSPYRMRSAVLQDAHVPSLVQELLAMMKCTYQHDIRPSTCMLASPSGNVGAPCTIPNPSPWSANKQDLVIAQPPAIRAQQHFLVA